MKMYKCKDIDCERVILEDRLLIHTPKSIIDGSIRQVYKCPYCRGRVEETNETDESTW